MTITYENLLAFLYREARLLDDKQWEEWLQLYAPDVEFWMPAWDDDGTLVTDPQREVSLIWDDVTDADLSSYRIYSRASTGGIGVLLAASGLHQHLIAVTESVIVRVRVVRVRPRVFGPHELVSVRFARVGQAIAVAVAGG